jgi:hypothetical protein
MVTTLHPLDRHSGESRNLVAGAAVADSGNRSNDDLTLQREKAGGAEAPPLSVLPYTPSEAL